GRCRSQLCTLFPYTTLFRSSPTNPSSTIASLRRISWYLTARPIRSPLSAGRSLHPAGAGSTASIVGRRRRRGITRIWVCTRWSAAEQADRCRSLHRVVPGRDAQLPVDRLDLSLDRVAGQEQPLGDHVGGEVSLQVGKQP